MGSSINFLIWVLQAPCCYLLELSHESTMGEVVVARKMNMTRRKL